MTRRLLAFAAVLCIGFSLASCGSSAYIADRWPHWAGGMPSGVPPRPGEPGYEEFIAHKQPGPKADKTGTAGTATAPQVNPASNSQVTVGGGLY